jgi:outer membrane protein OmpA-like peptidoglycan-associated protein
MKHLSMSTLYHNRRGRLRTGIRTALQRAAIVCAVILSSLPSPLRAQQAAQISIEQLINDADKKLTAARAKHLHIYSPRHFSKAEAALGEAKSLSERRRESDLIRIRAQACLDELDEAANTERLVRDKLGPAVAEREAALLVKAPDIKPEGWKRAEEKFFPAVRDVERGQETIPEGEIQEIAGAFRAVRREALREQILGDAKTNIELAEKAGAEKVCPALLGRAHQAVGRAEAALARENLDDARDEAALATKQAEQTRAFMDWVSAAQRDKASYEAALLPYLDLLKDVADKLNGDIDLSQAPDDVRDALLTVIEAREESLATAGTALTEQNESLSQSLQEAQTSLADAQAKISQLEERNKLLESQRSATSGVLQKNQELSQTMAKAQELFKPGEANVLQDEQGRVIIRLYGVNFAAGQSKIEKSQLKLIAKAAQAVNLFPGSTIRVEGHTDSDGGEEANQLLSEQRALEVGAALADALKIRADSLSAAGFGESKPLTDNNSKEGKARNRRIDIALTLP